MRIEALLEEIGEPEALEALGPGWDESLATYAGPPGFLYPEQYLENRRWCGLGPETEEKLHAAAALTRADGRLARLARHCRRLLFESEEAVNFAKWPSLERPLGELGGVFHLLAAMSLVPRVREVHAELAVPEEVTRDTLSQVACFAGNYRRLSGGRLGLPVNQLGWLRHYPRGELFRLGRMEYMPRRGAKGLAARVYRHRGTGRTVALLPDGFSCDREGFAAGEGEEAWKASLARNGDSVTGYPVSPRGTALPAPVTLSLERWYLALGADDPVLDMHIPAGGGMTPTACRDSLRAAAGFFGRLFPGRDFRAITCSSWIFNPALEGMALSSDNLARLQAECYLYPVPSGPTAGLWFIFPGERLEPGSLSRGTSLQRAVADYLAAGKRWRGGGMFFLLEDLAKYGTRFYRRQWPDSGPGAGFFDA